MGGKLSTDKYSLEISHICTNDNTPICCSYGESECLYTDDSGLYVFREKNVNNPKWLLYQGILKELVLKSYPLYLMPVLKIDNEKLEQSSLIYDNFYTMLQYINNDIDNKMFSMKTIAYNNSYIKNDYINNILE